MRWNGMEFLWIHQKCTLQMYTTCLQRYWCSCKRTNKMKIKVLDIFCPFQYLNTLIMCGIFFLLLLLQYWLRYWQNNYVRIQFEALFQWTESVGQRLNNTIKINKTYDLINNLVRSSIFLYVNKIRTEWMDDCRMMNFAEAKRA